MTLRLAALLGLGTLAVHQLRYLVGYHGHADAALASTGHAYLSSLMPAMAGVAVLTLAALIQRAARGARAPAPRFLRLWGASTLALVAVYALQEAAEGAPLTAHGGWVAFPLAAAIGLAIAAVMRGASAAGELAAARRPWSAPAPVAALAAPLPPSAAPAWAPALAHPARAPPSVSA